MFAQFKKYLNTDRTPTLEEGNQLFKQGKFAEAIECYHQIIEQNPNSAEAYQKLAETLKAQGSLDKATLYYRQAIGLNASNSEPKKNLIEENPLFISSGERVTLPKNALTFRLLPSSVNELPKKKISQVNSDRLNLGKYSQKIQTNSQPAKEVNKPHSNTVLRFEAAIAYLQQAEEYCEQKKWNEAIAACEKALQILPNMAEAYKIWGNVLQKMGNYTEAIGYYAKAIEIQPDLPEVYANLGTLYAQKAQWQKAVSYYQKAIDLKDDFGGAYRNLSKVWTKLGERDKALECQFQALNLEPQKATAIEHYEIGNEFGRQGRVEEAIACYRNAILLNPQFIKAYLNLAEALEQRGEWQEAGQYYRQVLHLTNAAETENLPQLKGSKTVENLLTGDREQKQLMPAATGAIVPHIQEVTVNSQSSQSTLDRAIQQSALLAGLQPESAEIQADLGSLYAKKQDWPKAIACYQKAIVLNPDFAGAYRNLAKVFSKIGEKEKAAEAWYQALTIEPDRSPVKQHLQLGKTLLEQGKTEQAVNCYRQAIRLKPELSQAYHRLGDILTQQGKEQEAIDLYRESIERNPQDAESYYRLGQICAKQEKWDEAIAYYRKSIELQPIYDKAYHHLGNVLFHQKNWQEAVDAYQRAIELNPDYFGSYNNLGYALFKLKRWEESASASRRSIELNPDLPWAHYNLGEALVELSQWDEAISAYRQALELRSDLPNADLQLANALYQKNNAERQASLKQKKSENITHTATKDTSAGVVLVIDTYPPYYDKESGSRRLFELLKIFRQLNYHTIFATDSGYQEEPYTSEMRNLQVEVLYARNGDTNSIVEQIKERLLTIDFAWICRPEVGKKYIPILRQQPKIHIVYDTIDLHYLRMKRAWELSPSPRSIEQAKEWVNMQARELKLAKEADLTIAITPVEKEILEQQSVTSLAVIPNIHAPYIGEKKSFLERGGILFIGGYHHAPNVDAVVWLCREIMPQVWQKLPHIKVTLLGSNPPQEVKNLASDRVIVTGYIPDVSTYFLSHRVFVSPLRYGAGMKGKIGQSLEYGLPIVSTAIGTEGMNLVPDRNVLEANTTEEFANQIIRLYRDERLWTQLSANAASAIEPYSPELVKVNLAQLMQQLSK